MTISNSQLTKQFQTNSPLDCYLTLLGLRFE